MKSKSSLFFTQLKLLSYSPLAWTGLFAVNAWTILYFYIGHNFFAAGSTDPHLFFNGFASVFTVVIPFFVYLLNNSYLEKNTSLFSYIFSKAAAVFAFTIFSVLLSILVPVQISFWGNMDCAAVFTGYLGILLYLLSVTCFCIFIRSLVSNTLVAFIVSFAALATVNFIHMVPVMMNLPQFFLWIVKGISFSWHFDSFGKGLLTSADLFYFVAATVLFYGLSIVAVEFRKSINHPKYTRMMVLLLAMFFLLTSLGGALGISLDLTKQKKYSLSNYTLQLQKEISEPFEITYYRSKILKNLYPQFSEIEDYLELLAARNKNIKVKTVNPKTQEEIQELENMGFYGREIKTNDFSSKVFSGIHLSYLGNYEIIPLVMDSTNLEYDLVCKIENLVRGNFRNIQIVCGDGKSLDDNYFYVRQYLQNQGFNVVQTYLPSQSGEIGKEISFSMIKDFPLLVLGTSQFADQDVEALEDYLESETKTFIATQNMDLDISAQWQATQRQDKVCRMLEKFGIHIEQTIMGDVSNFVMEMYSDRDREGNQIAPVTESVNYPMWPELIEQTFAPNGMLLFWCNPILVDDDLTNSKFGRTVAPRLVATENCFAIPSYNGTWDLNPWMYQDISGYEKSGTSPCVHYTRDKTQIMVFTSPLSFDALMFGATDGSVPDVRTYDFLTDSLLEMCNYQGLLEIKHRKESWSPLYKIPADSLLKTRNSSIFWTLVLTFSVYFVLALIVTMGRNRRLKEVLGEN